MKKRGVFKNDTFIVKNVPCGLEKFTTGKSCNNQRCKCLIAMKNWCYVVFFYTNIFFEPWGTFLTIKVSFLKISLFFCVWGTLIDPNLCWKSKFGSVNLPFYKLPFLPFYGLSAAFMAFSLKPMNFSEQLFAN